MQHVHMFTVAAAARDRRGWPLLARRRRGWPARQPIRQILVVKPFGDEFVNISVVVAAPLVPVARLGSPPHWLWLLA